MENKLDSYRDYLKRLPISDHTRRNYFLRVRKYMEWLSGSVDGSKALTEPVERDFAVQDYKLFLLRSGVSANTLNATLAAIDNYYLFLGLGASRVKRQELPLQAPRALEPEEYRRLLKVIAKCSSLRNKTIAMVMLSCGLRISEVAALNVSDVLLAARKRELIVRCGKNSKRRVIPINTDLAGVLREYFFSLSITDSDAPLFKSQKGNRLSVQAIDSVIRSFSQETGIDFSSHCLRHSCLTRLLRAGTDIVTVAEIAGHARLETSRRYCLPTEAVKVAAMEKIASGEAASI